MTNIGRGFGKKKAMLEEIRKMKEAARKSEMMEVNERYDRQIIRLSGFEW